MKLKEKVLIPLACVLALGAAIGVMSGPGRAHLYTGVQSLAALLPASAEKAPQKKPITIFFAGDIMLSRSIGRIMDEKGYDFPYALAATTTRSADISFANLETPVSDRGSNVGSIYSFRSDPKALAELKAAGFDVVSMANNHIWDYGRNAFLDTISNLNAYGIQHAGGGATFAEAHAPAMLEAGGQRIAFLAYTALVPKFLSASDSAPAVAYPDPKQIADDIASAKAGGADAVIVSFHWGTEYSTVHDASQEKLAHAAINSGALIVVGHHPHVAEEIERYKGGLIMYSLGNFIFDQNFSADTRHGLAVEVRLEKGSIASVEPLEVKFGPSYQPYIAGQWVK